MSSIKYVSEILIRQGRVRRNLVKHMNIDRTERFMKLSNMIKPLMNDFINTRSADELNTEIRVLTQYHEKSKGVTIEFKLI